MEKVQVSFIAAKGDKCVTTDGKINIEEMSGKSEYNLHVKIDDGGRFIR